MLLVFLFGRIVHRTIRIRPNTLKPLFGTPLHGISVLRDRQHVLVPPVVCGRLSATNSTALYTNCCIFARLKSVKCSILSGARAVADSKCRLSGRCVHLRSMRTGAPPPPLSQFFWILHWALERNGQVWGNCTASCMWDW